MGENIERDKAIAFFDIKELFNSAGDKLLPPEKLSKNALRVILRIEVNEGEYKYILHDRVKALERLSLLCVTS